jgi:hypothetical protein
MTDQPKKQLPVPAKKQLPVPPPKPLPVPRTVHDPMAAKPVAPTIELPPLPPPTGQRQKDGTRLVPYADRPDHPAFFAIRNAHGTLDTTGYVVDYKAGRIKHVLTHTKDNLTIGWDTCGECNHHVTRCRCGVVTMPNYVTVPGAKPTTPAREVAPKPEAEAPHARRLRKRKQVI